VCASNERPDAFPGLAVQQQSGGQRVAPRERGVDALELCVPADQRVHVGSADGGALAGTL
jgi:hypothetical protein